MGPGFAEKAIFNKKIDFPKIRYKNVQSGAYAQARIWTCFCFLFLQPFYHHFCTKTGNVVFQFAMSECRCYLKPTVVQIHVDLF